MAIEKDIIPSSINELADEEAIAVAKITEDPNFFFLHMQRGSLLSNKKLGHFILIMVL